MPAWPSVCSDADRGCIGVTASDGAGSAPDDRACPWGASEGLDETGDGPPWPALPCRISCPLPGLAASATCVAELEAFLLLDMDTVGCGSDAGTDGGAVATS